MIELISYMIPQVGVAGVAVYLMYKLTSNTLKKYPNTVSDKFEKVADRISELSNRIDKLNFLLERYLEVSKHDCVYECANNDENIEEDMGDNTESTQKDNKSSTILT